MRRMPKQHFVNQPGSWHCIGTRHPVSVSGRPRGVYLICQQMSRRDDGKDEALTTIVKVENCRQHYCHARKSAQRNFAFKEKAERPLLSWQVRRSQADEQLRESIESTQIPFLCQCVCGERDPEDTHPLSAAAARSFAPAADAVSVCWCTTELKPATVKAGRQIHSLFNWLNRRKLTATAHCCASW